MLKKTYQTIELLEHPNHILQITLNRPNVRNAINSQMMYELKLFWEQTYVQRERFRCIVLTGANPAFCSGADLKERADLDLSTWQQQHAVFEQAILAMIDCPLPVIAAVNGAAFGGGLELLLACDFAYAEESATFCQSETKIGLMPGALGTQHLPQACGLRRAKELAFTGLVFNSQQAAAWGIVNQVVKNGEAVKLALQTANVIAQNAPLAIQHTKKAMNMSQHLDVKTGFTVELTSYYQLLPSEDRNEGIRAFNEKRTPNFTGK